MDKKFVIGIVIFSIALLIIFAFASKNDNGVQENEQVSQNEAQATEENTEPQSKIPAEKIEVVHFHATQQCWSCKTVGEYALKTIKEKFPEEYKNGKIIFKDINGELPENRDIVIEYQARGSSLFINAIRNGEDNIEEDTTVWRLITNEEQFISYFEDKLKTLLGK